LCKAKIDLFGKNLKKLENETFSKKILLNIKALFLNTIPNRLLAYVGSPQIGQGSSPTQMNGRGGS
jgi:hypothetical protein